jgi:hypothetical protein
MIASAGAAPGQRQRLRKRNKSIQIGLYPRRDKLAGTYTGEHDVEQKVSPSAPPHLGDQGEDWEGVKSCNGMEAIRIGPSSS